RSKRSAARSWRPSSARPRRAAPRLPARRMGSGVVAENLGRPGVLGPQPIGQIDREQSHAPLIGIVGDIGPLDNPSNGVLGGAAQEGIVVLAVRTRVTSKVSEKK